MGQVTCDLATLYDVKRVLGSSPAGPNANVWGPEDFPKTEQEITDT